MVGKRYSKIVTQVADKISDFNIFNIFMFSIAGFQAHTVCQKCGNLGFTLVWVTALEVEFTTLTTSGFPTTFLC